MKLPINFDSKEIYLNWRQDWRQNYLELSESIRVHRQTLKNAQRKGCAGWDLHQLLAMAKNEARRQMEFLEQTKAIVRHNLRAMGINAPEPQKHVVPPPQPKHKWTAEEVARARSAEDYRQALIAADGHSD